MFKRRSTYLMEIDAQIHYPLEEVRRSSPDLAALSEEDQLALLAESLVRQVHEVAEEELTRQLLRATK